MFKEMYNFDYCERKNSQLGAHFNLQAIGPTQIWISRMINWIFEYGLKEKFIKKSKALMESFDMIKPLEWNQDSWKAHISSLEVEKIEEKKWDFNPVILY